MFNRIFQIFPKCGKSILLEGPPSLFVIQERFLTNERHHFYQMKLNNNKHKLPKWRRYRALKVIKVNCPDFHSKDLNVDPFELTPDEMRSKMKERGVQPVRPWQEKQIEITSTGDVFEPYIPPEGDGKASLVSTDFAKQKMVRLEKKSKSMLSSRKIRQYDEDFDPYIFAKDQATDIYIKMHEAMMTLDQYKIGEYVTEKALAEIMDNLELKTIRWKFLESIEPPRVVHIRHTDVISKDNLFAQITCRLHTKQTLTIYDRFGRLMHGNELTPKDVLEYVVYEKHLTNMYGTWRIHAKIIPSWKGVGIELESPRTTSILHTSEANEQANATN